MNLDVNEAAAEAKVHPDTLRKLAKAGLAPGAKIGRAWVFPNDLLQEWIKQKVKEQCHSTDVNTEESGGSALAARLASRRAQRIAVRQKSLRRSSADDSGDSENSETVVPFRGARPPKNG